MRPTARLVLGIGALIAFGVGPPRAQAQGYVYARRPAYAVPSTYYYVPQPQTTGAVPVIAYYPAPRTYSTRPQAAPVAPYQAAPLQPRGLLRVRKYSDRDSTPYKYILVDPNNRHWTFDYNDWMAHNF